VALIAGFLAALFLLPRVLFVGAAAALVAAGAHEWARLCRLSAGQGLLFAGLATVIFLALAFAPARAFQTAYALGAGFWLVVAPLWLGRGVQATHRGFLVAAGLVVLVPAAIALVSLAPQAVLAVLALVWIADTAAYLVGSRWGRRKLAPSISPGKTWEGAAGGMLAAVVYATGVGMLGRRGLAATVALGALLAVVSIVGDLFESAAKRQAGVKDSGAILPGHGGILDRIDSATAVLPIAGLLLSLPPP